MMKDVGGIAAWLENCTSGAVGHELIQELCARLTAAGVPLARAAVSVTMLDSNIAARRVLWTRDRAIEETEISHDLMESEAFLNRPLTWIQRARKPLQMKEGLSLGQVGQRPFEMGYKTMFALRDIKDGKAAPTDPTYTGLDVCTPETVDTCIAK